MKSKIQSIDHSTTPEQESKSYHSLLTKDELRQALNLPSTRMIDELMRRRKIPYLKLGHKTLRFDLCKVSKALEKLEVREIR